MKKLRARAKKHNDRKARRGNAPKRTRVLIVGTCGRLRWRPKR